MRYAGERCAYNSDQLDNQQRRDYRLACATSRYAKPTFPAEVDQRMDSPGGCQGGLQPTGHAQHHRRSADRLHTFFQQNIGLKDSELADIERGMAVAKILDSPTPSEVFVFQSILIRA
jgi:hypothetical protein